MAGQRAHLSGLVGRRCRAAGLPIGARHYVERIGADPVAHLAFKTHPPLLIERAILRRSVGVVECLVLHGHIGIAVCIRNLVTTVIRSGITAPSQIGLK